MSKDSKLEDKNEKDLSFLATAKSVFQAMLGVQSKKNARRDFSRGKASHFIIMGVVVGLLFVGGLIVLVNVMIGQLS